MKSSLKLPINIKAIDKVMKWEVVLNPVFFPYPNGFEVKVVKGGLANSIFCCKISDFEYSFFAKCQIWFIWKLYWCRNVFYRNIRYRYPYRVKQFFKKKEKSNSDLPF